MTNSLLSRPAPHATLAASALAVSALLAGCGSAPRTAPPPQLGAATPATLQN